MLTQSQAEYLLQLPKLLTDNSNFIHQKTYCPTLPINDRLYMASDQDVDFIFFLEIYQNSKNHLKLTLHFQEDETSIGLLRVDFNGRHKNPEAINNHVSDNFKPFAGQWIEGNHIHYYIEGYKPLAWAIPIENDTFSIKNFQNDADIANIIQAFGQAIHLQTKLEITLQTRLL